MEKACEWVRVRGKDGEIDGRAALKAELTELAKRERRSLKRRTEYLLDRAMRDEGRSWRTAAPER